MTSHDAYVVLNLLPGVGPVRVKNLLRTFETPERLLSAPSTALSRTPGIGGGLADVIARWAHHVDLKGELDHAERCGVCLVTPSDSAYPELLKEIYDPPLCLYVRGDPGVLNAPSSLAVVGSRRASRYGEQMAIRFSEAAVRVGMTVISGLARGIDTVTHQAVVDADGVTIAVLGGGIGMIYPQENVGLARAISGCGAVISEQPMQMKPDRRTFPMRNRIISGMSAGTLVVEAGVRSGALITAQQAVEQGRQVFAVPGRVDAPQSRGCHGLIKQGAKLVETIDDVLEEFRYLPGFARPARPVDAEDTAGTASLTSLTEIQQKIVALLDGDEMVIDDIQRHLGRTTHETLSNLLQLELKRMIVQLPGKRFALNRRTAKHG